MQPQTSWWRRARATPEDAVRASLCHAHLLRTTDPVSLSAARPFSVAPRPRTILDTTLESSHPTAAECLRRTAVAKPLYNSSGIRVQQSAFYLPYFSLS